MKVKENMELNFKESGIKEILLFLPFSRKNFIEEVGVLRDWAFQTWWDWETV